MPDQEVCSWLLSTAAPAAFLSTTPGLEAQDVLQVVLLLEPDLLGLSTNEIET